MASNAPPGSSGRGQARGQVRPRGPPSSEDAGDLFITDLNTPTGPTKSRRSKTANPSNVQEAILRSLPVLPETPTTSGKTAVEPLVPLSYQGSSTPPELGKNFLNSIDSLYQWVFEIGPQVKSNREVAHYLQSEAPEILKLRTTIIHFADHLGLVRLCTGSAPTASPSVDMAAAFDRLHGAFEDHSKKMEHLLVKQFSNRTEVAPRPAKHTLGIDPAAAPPSTKRPSYAHAASKGVPTAAKSDTQMKTRGKQFTPRPPPPRPTARGHPSRLIIALRPSLPTDALRDCATIHSRVNQALAQATSTADAQVQLKYIERSRTGNLVVAVTDDHAKEAARSHARLIAEAAIGKDFEVLSCTDDIPYYKVKIGRVPTAIGNVPLPIDDIISSLHTEVPDLSASKTVSPARWLRPKDMQDTPSGPLGSVLLTFQHLEDANSMLKVREVIIHGCRCPISIFHDKPPARPASSHPLEVHARKDNEERNASNEEGMEE